MELTQSPVSVSLLLVEDEKTARDLIARMLARKFPNCTIYTAVNGIEGMEIFKQFTPEIVIADIKMPVMDGLEMIREIKSAYAKVSCIVATAYSDKFSIDKMERIGICSYLLKPLDFDGLFAAIEKCSAEIKQQAG